MPIALFPLLAITFVDVLGFSILIPLLPYYAEHFGATPQMVGLLIATVAMCGLLSAPLLGPLSDRIGRRKILIFTQITTAISYILLARATTLEMLFVARAIEGISSGGIGVTQAYIADVTRPDQRTQAYGYLGMTFGIGFIFGPALSGFLIRYGYAVPFITAAILALWTVVLTITLLPESHTPKEASLSPWVALSLSLSQGPLRRLLGIQFCFGLAFTMWVSILALFLQHVFIFGPSQTSLLYSCSGVIGAIMQGLAVGRLVKTYGARHVLLAGLSCAFLSYICIIWVDRIPAMLLLMGFWSIGNALARPTLTTLLSQAAPPEHRGALMGASDGLNDLAFILGPLIASTALSINPHFVGILPAILVFLAMYLVRSVKTLTTETEIGAPA